jgi:hypothetical protein
MLSASAPPTTTKRRARRLRQLRLRLTCPLMTPAPLCSIQRGGVAANSGKDLVKWSWPPQPRGFLNKPVTTTLKAGTRIDRYGHEGGTFVSPAGTPFSQRALRPKSANAPPTTYEVTGDLDVQGGIAASWFGYPGAGVQYELPNSVADLISRGLLKPVG